jgi:hypothetical protein
LARQLASTNERLDTGLAAVNTRIDGGLAAMNERLETIITLLTGGTQPKPPAP